MKELNVLETKYIRFQGRGTNNHRKVENIGNFLF